MTHHQNEWAYGVVVEEVEERLLFPLQLVLVVAVASLILFLIHDGGGVVVIASLTLYFHDLLQGKSRCLCAHRLPLNSYAVLLWKGGGVYYLCYWKKSLGCVGGELDTVRRSRKLDPRDPG